MKLTQSTFKADTYTRKCAYHLEAENEPHVPHTKTASKEPLLLVNLIFKKSKIYVKLIQKHGG